MADRDVLERIAAALERLSPSDFTATDWCSHPDYVKGQHDLRAIERLDAVALERLRGIDAQKTAVLENLTRFCKGAAAHDMLLWGARGMGKSALIRSAVKTLARDDAKDLALVQVASDALHTMPQVIDNLGQADRRFVLFVDDLGFGANDAQDNLALRSFLEGGALSRPSNIVIAITSNRRAIVQRDGDEASQLHVRDERDNALALADRFGLTLAIHPCDQETYLEIVAAYVEPLGLDFDPEEACAWSIARGNRSGRTAFQFACEIAGRAGKALPVTG